MNKERIGARKNRTKKAEPKPVLLRDFHACPFALKIALIFLVLGVKPIENIDERCHVVFCLIIAVCTVINGVLLKDCILRQDLSRGSLPKINSKGQGSARKKGAALSFNQ